jgi:hypothetical protein
MVIGNSQHIRLVLTVLFLMLVTLTPLQAQSANIITVQPGSGAPGTTVVIADASGTNRGKVCFVSIGGEADSIGQMAGAITYVVPANLAAQTITFVCTGGMDGLRTNTASFVVTGQTIIAQPLDSDGDTLPDTRDNCPTLAGPVENGGCPITAPTDSDACPALVGIPASNGCPIPPSPTPAVVLPPLPTSGACVLATIDADFVNIRETTSTSAAIVAQLNPAIVVNVLAKTTTPEGEWFQIDGGWVAGSARRLPELRTHCRPVADLSGAVYYQRTRSVRGSPGGAGRAVPRRGAAAQLQRRSIRVVPRPARLRLLPVLLRRVHGSAASLRSGNVAGRQ